MADERLKETMENENIIFFINDLILEKNKLQQRIDKAVGYIKEHTTSFGDVFIPASESWYLSDILNGRSDE